MPQMWTGAQKRVFLGCFIAYAGAYIARLNLSAALPGVIADLGISEAQGGLLSTLFAVSYAAGQLVVGSMADHISARRFIAWGLAASAAINLLIGMLGSFPALAALSCLNGAAQSMLWTPVVKLLSGWFQGEMRRRASFAISITLIVGHLVAWAISGYLASLFSWRLSFAVPGAIALMLAAASWMLIRDCPEQSFGPILGGQPGGDPMPIGRMLLRTGLLAVLAMSVANGFVRDGVMAWGPVIIAGGAQGGDSVAASMIIPVLNLLGVLLGRYCVRAFRGGLRISIAAMMGAGALIALAVRFAPSGAFWSALMLGSLCALMYGINPLLTTMLPMDYAGVRRVGLAAGMIDCCIYLGSALAGVLTGTVSQSYGWPAVYALWSAVALAGMGLMLLSMRAAKSIEHGEVEHEPDHS